MAFVVKITRILFLFLILLQVTGIYYLDTANTKVSANYPGLETFASNTSSEETSANNQIESILYSPEKLQLPDALLSPIPSFQFGFIEVLGCFLFVIFSCYTPTKIKEPSDSFTNSYLHTLFTSAILINAP